MNKNMQQELIRELVVESSEGLDQFDRDLLTLEDGKGDGETLHRIFRAIHSLKGSSGCLGLRHIEELAHAGENLLSLLRDGRITANSDLVSTLFRYSDALRKMLEGLNATGADHGTDQGSLISELNALHGALSNAGESMKAGASGLFADEDSPAPTSPPAPVESAVQTAPPVLQTAPPPVLQTTSPSVQDAVIRVDVGQLDTLMDLVGELVLARNQIMQYAGNSRDPVLVNTTQRLNIITTKLQENVMKTRMQPIGNVWGKFPRIVRDLACELGKTVALSMEGNDTEMDRTILEAIKDPLTHLVRNAVDHGIEPPDQRTSAGKPAAGLIRLRAFHEGGHVIIEITDDGAGVDRRKVIRKAVGQGLVSSDEAARLSDREILALLFLPGFTTAERLSSVSGRGVGMDVVKKNIERIGGTVDIESEEGRSTAIRVKIPLTLAIIPALIVRCAARRYAIPQASLVELVRVDGEQSSAAIEYVGEYPVYRLRGNLLPLIELREQLRLEPAAGKTGSSIFVLVLQAEGRQFGLVVDSILDTEEIVVKPLGKELKNLSVYAGATIMGDGKVALILDINGIARRGRLLREADRASRETAIRSDTRDAVASQQRRTLLLIGLGNTQQAAIPLSSVARLEEFQPSSVEIAGNSEVVQYRGEIMPLVDIGRILSAGQAKARDAGESLKVVVYMLNGRSYGLVVDRILDTVESDALPQRCTNRPGVLGSVVLQQRVTDYLDIPDLVKASGAASLESSEGERA
jgi:two-component system chemotaxis sensor kinase CheA